MILSEVVSKIKIAGPSNTRIVPDGDKSIIEVNENGTWTKLLTNLSKQMAEDVISQASSRVILG